MIGAMKSSDNRGWLQKLSTGYQQKDPVLDNPDFLEYLEQKKRNAPPKILTTFFNKIVKLFSFILKAVFTIGILAFLLFEIDRVSDIPLGELTLREALIVPIGIFYVVVLFIWLFKRKE